MSPGPSREKLVHRLQHRLLQGLVALPGARLGGRTVAQLHRIGAPRHVEHRRPAEVPGKSLWVDGGRGDDQLEVGTARQELAQIAQQEVDVEAALVGLVDDQGVVLAEPAVLLDLGQQYAVGHQLDGGLGAHMVLEADLVAHGGAGLPTQLLGDARAQAARRDAPGLGVADAPVEAAAEIQTDLRQLGGLARAGLTAQHQHLVALDQLGDLGAALADGQLRGEERGRGQLAAAPGERFGRCRSPG